jgi:hypothetical protein
MDTNRLVVMRKTRKPAARIARVPGRDAMEARFRQENSGRMGGKLVAIASRDEMTVATIFGTRLWNSEEARVKQEGTRSI